MQNSFTIRGAQIVDGTEADSFRGDVVVSNGIILEIRRDFLKSTIGKVIDGNGLTLTPGFIDMHSHSDLAVISDSQHLSKVTQGVTLEVLGQDGLSYAPTSLETMHCLREQLYGWNGEPNGVDWNFRDVGQYLDQVDKGAAVNVAYLIPHGTIRMLVRGYSGGHASEDELDKMKVLVEDGMKEGAFGLSAGLTYIPGMYASDDELVELCRVVAKHGGYYAPHHRNYGLGLLNSIESCLEISRQSGAPLHLTHCHMSAPIFHGKAHLLLDILDAAIARGMDISLDSYPYLAGSSYLHALLPSWVQEGGKLKLHSNLRSIAIRAKVINALDVTGSDGNQGGVVDWAKVVLAGAETLLNQKYVGKSIEEIARLLGINPAECYLRIIVEEDFKASCIVFAGNEDNVRAIMKHDRHMVGSDGILNGNRPHPRAYGTFARYLGVYAREENVITFEGAVARMTGRPAKRLGLHDRGLIKPRYKADLVLLDRDTVLDAATYETPRIPAVGFEYVWISGVPTLQRGLRTDYLPGRALRKNQ